MNSLPLSHVVISWLTRFYLENRYLQILPNTVALDSYLGLSVLSNFFFWFVHKFDKGSNSLPKQLAKILRLSQ